MPTDPLQLETQHTVVRLSRVAVEAAIHGSDAKVIRCLGVRPRRGHAPMTRTPVTGTGSQENPI